MGSFVRISALVWADILAGYALWVMITYLTNVWKLNFTHAAAIVNFSTGAAAIMPIVMAFLVHAFMSDFWMLLLSSLAFSFGLSFLAMSMPPVLSKSAGNCTVVTAGADDGSVWIAHAGQISGYDWNLTHAGTIRTHLEDITSIRRVWPEVAAVGSETAAGLHFYDFSGGRHVGSAHWTDPSDPRIYKARVTALADSDTSVFASFDCRHGENCILVIDKSTLQIESEFGRQNGSSTKSMVPGKLTYLPERNVLLGSAVTAGAFGYSGYIRLWDPRSGEVVWETIEPGSGRSSRFGDSFADVDVDLDESTLFKICSQSGDLAMADLRNLGDDPWVYLKDKNPIMRNTGGAGSSVLHCYRKQVFAGIDGGLEVWSRMEEREREDIERESRVCEGSYRRNYVDKVEDSERGIIQRIEGGGDRLFVSREGVEGIEVWESSSFSGVASVL